MCKDDSKVSTHTSYHNSGQVNYDYTGKSGTIHEHGGVVRWENNPDAHGTLYKGEDGVWRYADGEVFRGS